MFLSWTESFQLPVEASYPHPTAKSFQLLYYCRLQSLSHIWLILTQWLHSAVHRIILLTFLIPGHRILLAKKCVKVVVWHFTQFYFRTTFFAKHDGLWHSTNRSVMAIWRYLFLYILFFTNFQTSSADSKVSDVVYNLSKESELREPSVFLAIIARNAAHLLPNWLGYIDNLDYPKSRISVW